MPSTSYLTVARDVEVETRVEGSRFLCTLIRVEDEMFARATIERSRREHWDARQHCSAMVLGPEGETEGTSDDGEPAGTAGAPMLAQLRGWPDPAGSGLRGVSDVVAVVSRWTGGGLLGTGGLARAYAGAVAAAIEEAGCLERVLQEDCAVSVDHAAVGRLQHALRARGTRILATEYDEIATVRVASPPARHAAMEELVAEVTNGEATVRWAGTRWVDLRARA